MPLPLAAATISHEALVFGVVLVAGALVSGLTRRTFLAAAPLFVLAGFAVGAGGLGFLELDATSGFVGTVATVALVVLLFRDGLEVEGEMLQREWHLPARKLVVGMPLTAGIVAVAAHALTSLSWTESFLVGALLSPTDPVLSSGVVTNPRVPRLVRHSLNLESGLNDGLALAPVLALLAALSGEEGFVWWRFVLQDVGLGVAYGVAAGFAAGVLLPRRADDVLPDHQRALFALGVAFATYGLALLPPEGNGFIAVFVAAIVLGIRRPDVRHVVEERSDDVVEIVKLGVFVVFGALLTLDGLFGQGLAAVALVAVVLLVARPAAVAAALVGSGRPAAEVGFMAWFGPKGVATMAFSLLVLGSGIPAAGTVFDLAALCVVVSVFAHGLTDTAGVAWMGRRRPPEDGP